MKQERNVLRRDPQVPGLIAALIVGFLAQPCFGQTGGGDFGGSFDEPVAAQPALLPTAPPAAPTGGDIATAPQGGDFGGSFDDGAFPAADPVEPAIGGEAPPQSAEGGATQPIIGGGDFGEGGSFEPAGGGGVSPPPNEPVAQPKADPQPAQEQTAGPAIDPQITAYEMRDFGVPAVSYLRSGQMHAPTPTAVPGGQTVTTEGLASAMASGMQLVVIDVLGGNYSLPNAYVARELASPGSFNDRTQQRASQWLGQITGGVSDVPVVIYCSGPECWLSYNAVLRTVAAGYTNVYWYRGGLEAWQMAGLQLYPAAF